MVILFRSRMSLVLLLGSSFYFYTYNVGACICSFTNIYFQAMLAFFLSNKMEMCVYVEYVWIDGLEY